MSLLNLLIHLISIISVRSLKDKRKQNVIIINAFAIIISKQRRV